MQTITAADLVLEPLVVAHAPEMFEVLCDPLTHRYLDHPPPPSVDHLRAVYKQLETRKSPDGRQLWLNWVVRLPGQPPMGYVQATVVSRGRAWVAYLLASKHWGRGHAYAAMQAMLGHLGLACGVGLYMATVEAGNQRSIRLLQRLGFHAASAQEAEGHQLSATERLFLR
ncbi:MAG TPA: GNAT family N-acetyltransferase [Burkholderiaceae bacterium]|nr:GNAT family N-acetyltransferase [Burkholderiaceae bacterium]